MGRSDFHFVGRCNCHLDDALCSLVAYSTGIILITVINGQDMWYLIHYNINSLVCLPLHLCIVYSYVALVRLLKHNMWRYCANFHLFQYDLKITIYGLMLIMMRSLL